MPDELKCSKCGRKLLPAVSMYVTASTPEGPFRPYPGPLLCWKCRGERDPNWKPPPELRKGDVVRLDVGFKVYAERAFTVERWVDVDATTRKKVTTHRSRETETTILEGEAGEYVVVRVGMQGGGTGMGPHDVYPSGWYVRLRKLGPDGRYDENGHKVAFYQSGCFTVQHDEPIPVVRKLVHRETFE